MGLGVGWFVAAYLAGAAATYGSLLHAARSKIRAQAKSQQNSHADRAMVA